MDRPLPGQHLPSPSVRAVLHLAWPVVASMLLHNSYHLIDMFWVAQLGRQAIAAVTLAGLVLWLMFAVSQIFATGVQAVIARAYGAEMTEHPGIALRDGLLTAMLTGVIFAIVIALLPASLLKLLGATDSVARTGIPYLSIIATGIPASIALFTIGSAFRALGDMMTPLWITGVSCVLNMILDPLLIFGWGPIPALGLAGAAVATVVAIYLALGTGLLIALRKPIFRTFATLGPIHGAVLGDILSIGIPSGLHYILLSLTDSVMIRLVAPFGTATIAATGIGSRISHFAFLPCMGIGAATATLIGHYLGAGRPSDGEQTVRLALILNIVPTACICAAFVAFPAVLLGLFTTDTTVIGIGIVYMRIFALSFLFTNTTIILTRVFQGAGDTVWPTFAAAFRFVIFAALAGVFGWMTHLGALGVWLAMGISSAIQMVLVVILYTRGSWKRKRIVSVDLAIPSRSRHLEP